MTTTKQSLLQLLADNQMDSLFGELKSRHGYYSDLILLEGQWNDLRSKQRNATISDEQANLEVARIRRSLLDLIETSFGERPIFATAAARHSAAFTISRRWILRTACILATAIMVLVIFLNPESFNQKNSNRPNEAVTSNAAVSNATVSSTKESTEGQVKKLEIYSNLIAINKGQIGDITYKLLSAELTDMNPENWLLRIKARVIKPAYGASVVAVNLHIAYGDFEKIPVHIDFPYVSPGTTEDGVVEFEVPKTYKEVNLLIYAITGDPPGATIPIKL